MYTMLFLFKPHFKSNTHAYMHMPFPSELVGCSAKVRMMSEKHRARGHAMAGHRIVKFHFESQPDASRTLGEEAVKARDGTTVCDRNT